MTLGIFSLFGKRDAGPTTATTERARTSARSDTRTVRLRAEGIKRQAAEATSLKIDTIEFEMAAEFIPASVQRNPQRRQDADPGLAIKAGAPEVLPKTDALIKSAMTLSATTLGMFDSDSIARTIAMSGSEAAPVIDEAAILFALGEMATVEELLKRAIEDAPDGADRKIAWAMLLDLYQVMDQRAQFDDLSIAYASTFETSPPAWIDLPHQPPSRILLNSGKTPVIVFSGKLDNSIVAQIKQLQTQANDKRSLRVEFTRVTEVDPVGCALLLAALKKLHTPDHDLVLVGAFELTTKIRQIVQVGRRDDSEAPWLLLLEIFRLLKLEKDFEDSSIDYCVTYEVSPPAFIAPKNKVTTAAPGPIDGAEAEMQFMMPAVIAEHSDALLAAIEAYAKSHNPASLNCSHLVRVDFNAANQLLARLHPLVIQGAHIRMHHVNHLVAALLRVIGLHELLHIELRKI
jgi:ABC-type transporter Mla MlaB component